MRDKALIAIIVFLGFMGIAVDFTLYILSLLSDALFVGGMLYAGYLLMQHKNRVIAEQASVIAELRRDLDGTAARAERLVRDRGGFVTELPSVLRGRR